MSLRMRVLLGFGALSLIVMFGMAVAGAGTGDATDESAQMIADAKRTERAIVAALNNKQWDELRALYAPDAVLFPPNHDPVQGRDAIVDYIRGVRDVIGAIDDDGEEYLRVKANGTMASFATTFTANSSHLRLTDTAVYERQPDGSVLMAVEHVGLRERPVA